MKKILYILLGALMLGACVPTKEFSLLSEKTNSLQGERDELMKENEYLTVENREMNGRIEKVESQQARLVQDSIRIYRKIDELEKEMTALERKYIDLESAHEALLRGNERETRRLLNELQTTQEDLNRLNAELEARNARLMEMEAMLYEKDRVLDDLRTKVADALMGFEGQGLTVTRKDGKVYVSLDEKLLFKSGSTSVDPNGVKALRQLAVVLGNNPDINIMIEGHTDDVPFRKGSSIKDNWDLSVMRATSIVRIMMANPNIKPTNITVAGRGEYLPVDSADTPEARRKNRRTEIILSPDFAEIFRILDM